MEGGVLLRVQGLQKGAGRVALEIGTELVHLVKDDDGVGGAGTLDAAQDPARESSHVGFAVAADFGLVVHAAKGNADVLAAEGACDALSKGCLSHSGRAPEAENRRAHVTF